MKQNFHALVIDDEIQVRRLVTEVLELDGWTVSEAENAGQAFEWLSKQSWMLIFCDVVLGGTNGYDVLRRFSQEQPEARFVLMTGYGSAAGALDATAIGAYDYLVKPFDLNDILKISAAVREYFQTRRATKESSAGAPPGAYTSDIPLIGRSPKFVECLKVVGRIAATNLPVLITGESGTGKEVVAHSIHRRSSRAEKSFVAVNCGAIPDELIESELFGHIKGAFTGAERERAGLWEDASGGTILLDEITETSPRFQVKLLRALQQGEIRRVGSNQTLKVDVRVIAATNRDIETEVLHGRFRQDLMYRLNAVTIHLPPLRERVEDIPLLAEHFAVRVRPAGAPPVTFSPMVLKILASYDWSGNVRELENAVMHAVSLCDDTVYPEHLPERLRRQNKTSTEETGNAGCRAPGFSAKFAAAPGKWLSLAEMEVKYAAEVLTYTAGNKQAAARLLGIDRKTLTRIISRAKPQV